MKDKKVLDVCCGPKSMWFDKKDDRVLFLDKRRETHKMSRKSGNRVVVIDPDEIGDFTDIKYDDNTFTLIVFDPPHIPQETQSGNLCNTYGNLSGDWKGMLKKGFKECFRVLKTNGILIFKWNECRIPIKEILLLCDEKPLFGHISGKQMNTHWVTFMKE